MLEESKTVLYLQDISLILFDTSSSEDININQTLLEKLKQMPGVIPTPVTPAAASPAPSTPAKNGPSSQAASAESSSPSSPKPTTPEIDLTNVDLASLKPLVPAAIPEDSPYFDVYVTLAASPSNFTVSGFFSFHCKTEELPPPLRT